MSNSSLVDYVKISPNRGNYITTNGSRKLKREGRLNKIDTITIHCVVGQCSVQTLGEVFANWSRQASSNYGIGTDGKIGMYVEENDRSWCSSSSANDNRAITIECASDTKEPYAVNDKAYASLIKLCADICKRNGISKLLWSGDKTLIGNVAKQNMTVHRWFGNTSCPGTYLFNKMGQIAEDVNNILYPKTVSVPTKSIEEIAKEVINGKWGVGEDRKKKLEAAGYNYTAVQNKVNELVKPKATPVVETPKVTKVVASGYAQKYDRTLAGNYKANAAINLRDGGSLSKKVIGVIPEGTVVTNYGYYSVADGLTWLYVKFILHGVTYTGFASKFYLKK